MWIPRHGIIQSAGRFNFTPLLDIYTGAAAAYSFRKLRTAYTGNAFRLRHAVTNAEIDIPFTSSGVIDESLILSFLGTINGHISIWYDQSGNARNLSQSNINIQPRIADSGVIEKQNGKPAANFPSTQTEAYLTSTSLGGFSRLDQFFVVQTTDTQYLYPRGNISYGFVSVSGSSDTNIYSGYGTPSLYVNNSLQSVTTRGSVYTAQNGYKLISHINSNTVSGWTSYHLGWFQSSSTLNFLGKFQEIVIYSSDQSSNLSGIHSNINSYYSIY